MSRSHIEEGKEKHREWREDIVWPEVRKCHQDTTPEDEGPIL